MCHGGFSQTDSYAVGTWQISPVSKCILVREALEIIGLGVIRQDDRGDKTQRGFLRNLHWNPTLPVYTSLKDRCR
jgi:hypothetical protein